MAEKNYDSTQHVITGDKLMIYVETKAAIAEPSTPAEYLPIAFGTSCSIEISGDTIDTSNKMSGAWKEYLLGQSSYTVSCESLYSKKEGHLSFKMLKDLMVKRMPITFFLSEPADQVDYEKGADLVTGQAIITALSMTANNGEICTCSITLQGTGALEDADTE